MPVETPLEALRNQVRRHRLRLCVLALATQGKSLDPTHLRQELPTHPEVRVINYHLSVLRQVELLPC
jgi:hypothetical protein